MNRFEPYNVRTKTYVQTTVKAYSELDAALEKLRTLKALHYKRGLLFPWCDCCQETYPCRTIQILDGNG